MTKILSGIGSLSQLSQMRSEFNAKTVLLVTGKASYFESGAKSIVETALHGDTVVRFNDFDVNPKIEDAERGVALALEFDVDLILGIGGGSVMDMAKLIKAFYTAPDKSKKLATGELSVSDPKIPMMLIPTTAGSGSEATHFAVVYVGPDKFSLASQVLLPEACILDGSLIASASPYQIACNGLDAMAQAIESAWAVGSTEQSREYSFRAAHLCAKYLKKALAPDASVDAFQEMIEAANLAGQAINISKTTSAHAWSYSITTHYGVPHGHAVWLTLPRIFQIHAMAKADTLTDPRGIGHFSSIMTHLMDVFDIISPEDCASYFGSYLEDIGVESNMAKIGPVTTTQRKFLSQQVNLQRMDNNPIRLTAENINYIFDLQE